MDSSSCGATYTSIGGCNDVVPVGDSADSYYFSYSHCRTPVVTSVQPDTGTTADVFTLHGRGFSTSECQNKVLFGDLPCKVTFTNSSYLICEMADSVQFEPGVAQMVQVHVHNLGDAIVECEVLSKRYIFLVPYIRQVSPQIGSIKGGTLITISGSGFLNSDSGVVVNINGMSCAVRSVTPDTITCVTGLGYSMVNASVSVSVDNGIQWVPGECRGQCTFTYSTDSTPYIYSIMPSSITQQNQTITIKGTGFSLTGAENVVHIDDTPCVITSSTATELECNAGSPVAGSQSLDVIVDGLGRAAGMFSVPVSPTNLTVSPTEGSTAGGQHLTVSGFGFSTGAQVEIGGQACSITSITVNEVGPWHFDALGHKFASVTHIPLPGHMHHPSWV